MSKSDTPLSGINTSKARSTINGKTPWLGEKQVHAFDTETRDGDVFMLSAAPAGSGGYVVTADNYPDTIPTDRLLRELTRDRYRSGINVWYNIGFDVSVIFSGLPESVLQKLRHTGRTEYEPDDGPRYEITYIPGKALTIRKHNNKWEHFDVGQILSGGLEKAAEEWLGAEKLTETVDVERFSDPEYLIDHEAEITTYARRDAELTRDVWLAFAEVAESGGIEIPCGRPYSTGYLAASYLQEHLSQKPGWGITPMQSMAWDAFHGGRFEVAKRGAVGEVAVPDINSAYPHVMSELPDPATLQWDVADAASLDVERLNEADYGFVEITVSTSHEKPLQPFAVKVDGAVRYPILTNERITVLIDEFLFALDHGYLTDYTLHSATLGTEIGVTRRPFDFLPSLYRQRKTWEDPDVGTHRPRAADALKIVINSMYGKTAQTQMVSRAVTEEISAEEIGDLPEWETFEVHDQGAFAVITAQESGPWFNPFLAAYTTGMTRLELLRRIEQYDLLDATVMLATDSLMIEREPFERSTFADDLVKPGLGNWDYDAQGDAFVVGSGVYEVRDPETGETLKTGSRGFDEADLDGGLWSAAEGADGDRLPIVNWRPITLTEALHSPSLSLSDVGRFRKTERGLRAGFDDGRVWRIDSPSFDRLLSTVETSEPIDLAQMRRDETDAEWHKAKAREERRYFSESLDSHVTDAHEIDSRLGADEMKKEIRRSRMSKMREQFR